MEKVIVIGCAGSGKSEFARRLNAKTSLPLYYLDMVWHRPDKTTIPADEFDEKLKEIVSGNTWIIDGNYTRTLDVRLRNCDTVFFLDLPLKVCLSGAEARIGKIREDLPWVESEFDESFRHWIIDFPNNQLPKIYELLDKYGKDRQIIIFKSREEIDEYFSEQ